MLAVMTLLDHAHASERKQPEVCEKERHREFLTGEPCGGHYIKDKREVLVNSSKTSATRLREAKTSLEKKALGKSHGVLS
ncbi:hypothetical protein MRX96_008957 [Rhipicephalus microplus]